MILYRSGVVMDKHDASRSNMRERGIALVAVLGFLAVMSLIVLTVVGATRTSINATSRHLARAQAQAAIESGIELAANILVSARGTIPQLLSERQSIEIGGFRVTLSARTERAKVDLNQADQVMLTALFKAAGADTDRAQALAAAIEDWRDADDLLHLNGAELAQYKQAGRNYGPANHLFEAVGELRHVLGMDEKIFACVRPELTILTQAPGIDIAAANPNIQRQLGVEPRSKTSIPSVLSVTGGQLLAPGDVFEIIAELDDAKRNIRRAERVSLRITGNPEEPYWILNVEPEYPLREQATNACTMQGPDDYERIR